VTLTELMLGEMSWAATKARVLVQLRHRGGRAVGRHRQPVGHLLAVPALALGAVCFACCGLVVTAQAKTWDIFAYFFTFWVTPMFMFSGTFFEVTRFPVVVQAIAWVLPMTHLIAVVRPLAAGAASMSWRRPAISATSRCWRPAPSPWHAAASPPASTGDLQPWTSVTRKRLPPPPFLADGAWNGSTGCPILIDAETDGHAGARHVGSPSSMISPSTIAAYLELAIRRKQTFASRDAALIKAGKKAGLDVLGWLNSS